MAFPARPNSAQEPPTTQEPCVQLSEFDYDLPPGSIAQVPVEPRDAARLLIDRGPVEQPLDSTVGALGDQVGPGDVVVVNSTRVRPARLRLRRATGGAAEVLLLSPIDDSNAWEALVRPSRKVAPGDLLRPPGQEGTGFAVRVGEDRGEGRRRVTLLLDGSTLAGEALEEALDRHGVMPLPPYLDDRTRDPGRYQTVFADRPGSAAAPTAGLHLTPEVLARVRGAGAEVVEVDLEVGLGTFRPMTADRVEDHRMHAERYRISPEAWAAVERAHDPATPGSVLAVGTTSLRALESAARTGDLSGSTELFLHRGAKLLVVDRLMTNFHLPCSSLLVLIDAVVGPRWRSLYETALARNYRFLSFGDAMLLEARQLDARQLEARPGSDGGAEA